MSRLLQAPGRYIQGAGAIDEIGEHAAKIGTHALLTGGEKALSVCGNSIANSLQSAGMDCRKEGFQGECSDQEINRLISTAQDNSCNLIVAAGGGKVIDTGKAVAMRSRDCHRH